MVYHNTSITVYRILDKLQYPLPTISSHYAFNVWQSVFKIWTRQEHLHLENIMEFTRPDSRSKDNQFEPSITDSINQPDHIAAKLLLIQHLIINIAIQKGIYLYDGKKKLFPRMNTSTYLKQNPV